FHAGAQDRRAAELRARLPHPSQELPGEPPGRPRPARGLGGTADRRVGPGPAVQRLTPTAPTTSGGAASERTTHHTPLPGVVRCASPVGGLLSRDLQHQGVPWRPTTRPAR